MKDLSSQLIYNILKIISCNGDILSIINKGYLFSQVTLFFDELRDKKYMEYRENILVVTKEGKEFIRCYEIDHEINNESKWILKQESMWKTPIDKFQVYIPKQKPALSTLR